VGETSEVRQKARVESGKEKVTKHIEGIEKSIHKALADLQEELEIASDSNKIAQVISSPNVVFAQALAEDEDDQVSVETYIEENIETLTPTIKE